MPGQEQEYCRLSLKGLLNKERHNMDEIDSEQLYDFNVFELFQFLFFLTFQVFFLKIFYSQAY